MGYKVGDKVRIKPRQKDENRSMSADSPGYDFAMARMEGKTFKITDMLDQRSNRIKVQGYWWLKEWLQPLTLKKLTLKDLSE